MQGVCFVCETGPHPPMASPHSKTTQAEQSVIQLRGFARCVVCEGVTSVLHAKGVMGIRTQDNAGCFKRRDNNDRQGQALLWTRG